MPVTAAIVAGGAQALTTGYKAFQGAKQKKEGENLESSLTRPTYQISDYQYDNLDIAKQLSQQGIMDAEESQYLDNIARAETSGIRNFRSRRAGVLGAEVVGEQSRGSMRDLLVLDAQQRLKNTRELMRQNQIMAEEQKTQFQINELDPYAQNLNYARALQGAGMQNINTSIESFNTNITSLASGFSGTDGTTTGK